MRSSIRCARFLGMVCLLVWCVAVFGDEDFERMLELYRQSNSAGMEQRLRDYEALQEMRRVRGERHLPAGSQFDFARESYRRLRSEAPGVTGANGCAWTSAGPTNLNGRVISIAIDPMDNQSIYAATVGGLWRSTDAGRRWQRVSDENMAMRYSAVAVNPGDSTDIFAGAGDRNMSVWETGSGLWRSDSSGAPGSWTKATTVFDGTTIYRIRIDPDPPYDVYVAATNGVWVGQHNGGAITFTPVGNLNAVTHDMAIDFSTATPTIYATVRVPKAPFSVNVYKWNGSTWDERGSGLDLGDAETISIALSQSQPNILYAKVSQKSDGTHVGVYKTTTGAEKPAANKPAWNLLPGAVPDDIMGWYNTLLEVDPTDPNRVFAGSIHLWMSTDGGVQWDDAGLLTDPDYPLEAHGDFHALAFDPTNPKIVYVGNDGGIDRSTDMSQPKWHWVDVAHGMIITMYWNLTSNRAYPTLLAGGTQDNGTGLTFGNRTWYQPWGCDGYDVGSDAANPVTLFVNCNQGLALLGNPVNGTPGFPSHILWDKPKPRPPLITDDVIAGAALAAGDDEPCGTKTVLKTTNGVIWTPTSTGFADGASVIALASAPSAAFQTYLAAVEFKDFDPEACKDDDPPNPAWTSFKPFVARTDDGGMSWTTVTGLPNTYALPSSVAFDPYDKNRSYVTYRNGGAKIYMSTGGAYTKIGGSFPTWLPGDVRQVVVDPFDTNVLYAATNVGMFRGEVTLGIGGALPTAKWSPFDEGLPDGMEINDLWIDPADGILTIGSFGYGAFRRNIRKDAQCAPRMLVVRDCVNDDGRQPSPCGGPDPEHPIPIGNSGFYQPDDSYAGSSQWFASRDIRIDVPLKDPLKNQIENADSVEFELCPTSIADCPAQSMIDSAPVGLEKARVYVQVTNRGVEPVNKTRVIALWIPSAAAFDALPATFWTKTFPANGKCGPLDPTTGWQLVDPIQPCRTISTVTPDVPELARFEWNVPFAANGGATMLTVVESADDPLDPSIRGENKLWPIEIVPGSRHIALRNLRIQGIKIREIQIPKMWPLDLLKLPEEMSEVEIVVSKTDLRQPVRIVLPPGLTAHAGFGSARRTRVTEEALVRQLEDMRLDPDNAWELSGNEASFFVDLEPGQRVTTAVIATPDATGATSQVSIVERSRGEIVGGSVMLLRPEM